MPDQENGHKLSATSVPPPLPTFKRYTKAELLEMADRTRENHLRDQMIQQARKEKRERMKSLNANEQDLPESAEE